MNKAGKEKKEKKSLLRMKQKWSLNRCEKVSIFFLCENCDYITINREMLKMHIQNHHGDAYMNIAVIKTSILK